MESHIYHLRRTSKRALPKLPAENTHAGQNGSLAAPTLLTKYGDQHFVRLVVLSRDFDVKSYSLSLGITIFYVILIANLIFEFHF